MSNSTMVMDPNNNPYNRRPKLTNLLNSDASIFHNMDEDAFSATDTTSYRQSDASMMSGDASPYLSSPSPWNNSSTSSPYSKSPWRISSPFNNDNFAHNGLIHSIVREEGHIYSIATSGDLLYTGSDSRNIRVWKSLKDYSSFRSRSGLIKSIVVSGKRIFTGHQDGKIRIWKVSSTNPRKHKRIGTLPNYVDFVKKSVNPKNFVKARRNKDVVNIQHFDAISSMSMNEEIGLLYTASWDKTIKVWRIANSKCIESIEAHDDAINAVVTGFDDLVFTGSADGTVKMWKRELQGKRSKHFLVQILMKKDNAVTALTVSLSSAVVYSGSSDGLVNFWEYRKHLSHGGTLRGHKVAVLCLVSAGNLVFSGSADKNICVWRRLDDGAHACLSVLSGHTGPVKCLAVDEDKTRGEMEERRWILYSGSLDRSVKVWRVAEQTPTWGDVGGGASGRESFSSSPTENFRQW